MPVRSFALVADSILLSVCNNMFISSSTVFSGPSACHCGHPGCSSVSVHSSSSLSSFKWNYKLQSCGQIVAQTIMHLLSFQRPKSY
ncbi:hypothetical protein HDV62DRAFT_353049 [Trichoderma sp. SZMC 28011]